MKIKITRALLALLHAASKDETLEKKGPQSAWLPYPNWQLIYPPVEPKSGYHRIVIGLPILEDLVKAVKAYAGNAAIPGVVFYAPDADEDKEFNHHPIPIEFVGVEDGTVKGLVMPIRR